MNVNDHTNLRQTSDKIKWIRINGCEETEVLDNRKHSLQILWELFQNKLIVNACFLFDKSYHLG
jgi:hypothetical protein